MTDEEAYFNLENAYDSGRYEDIDAEALEIALEYMKENIDNKCIDCLYRMYKPKEGWYCKYNKSPEQCEEFVYNY